MKENKVYKVIAILLSIVMIVLMAFFAYQLIKMDILPQNLFIPVILIFVLISLILILWINLMAHGVVSKVFAMIFVLLYTVSMGIGNFYVYKTDGFMQKVTDHKIGDVKNTVSIIVMDDSNIKDLSSLKGKKVGRLNNVDKVGTNKLLKSVKKKKGSNYFKTKKFDGALSEVEALYNGEIDAMILNESYRGNVTSVEEYEHFSTETRVVYSTSYYTTKKNDSLVVSDITKNPFTILISGNDTTGDVSELSRSDVNMLVTINPKTSTILLTSMSRDTYVETVCDADGDTACPEGQMDKITHTGIYGLNTTRQTVEKFYDLKVNYSFRVNFTSVIDVVDALDGIDLNVEEGEQCDLFWANMKPGLPVGLHHVDGETALAFARERKAYVDGDYQRVRNQQKVMQAIINRAISSSALVNYTSFINSLESAFETNMTYDEITDLIKYELQAKPDWKFETYQISGLGDELMCASLGQAASVQVPDLNTVRIAREKIEAVMNGKSSSTVAEDGEPQYDYYPSQSTSNSTDYLTPEVEDDNVYTDQIQQDQTTYDPEGGYYPADTEEEYTPEY
ncbi:LCP family protein [Holdemanella biformis]|uniref:LCP family protein n=1 Tax=Holdemanella biformis TaxID=1735 RepID=UPI001C279C4C|nr:LCP family protein [Holdemanella biformis]MBU9895373.1 LCP family protein [Holdemanella biformis]MBV3416084.1 LCP family protein [Holdemanella biformis]